MELIAYTKKVIVEPISKTTESQGGIIVNTEKPADEGIVIAKGPDVESDLNIGDKVAFNEYGGKKYSLNNKTYICLHENELYCGIK